MYSFKQNMILLTTFNVIVLYMITTANANCVGDCLSELSIDGFDFIIENGFEHVVYTQSKRNDLFITPHGKTYHKFIFNYNQVNMYQMDFCLWLYSSNPKYIDLWKKVLNDLHNYTHICRCQNELQHEGFSLDLEHGAQNITLAQNPIEHFNTPHSKIYRTMLMTYGVHMFPIDFCPWINLASEIDLSPIFSNTNLPEIWRHLVQDLTTEKYIGTCPNIHENMCLKDLKLDNLNIDAENEHTTLMRELYLDYFTSPYGRAYFKLYKRHGIDKFPRAYCKWITGNKNDVYHRHLNIWYTLNEAIDTAICADQLKYDEFKLRTHWVVNKMDFHGKTVEDFKTWHSKEYWKYLMTLVDHTADGDTPYKFCLKKSKEHIRQITALN